MERRGAFDTSKCEAPSRILLLSVAKVDPKFAYAYTLLGHQYLALEETDKAMDCFKNAVRVDPIHYNGWYGLLRDTPSISLTATKRFVFLVWFGLVGAGSGTAWA